MALTKTLIKNSVRGNTRVNTWDITFDNSYATGGLALTPADLGLTQVAAVDANPVGGRSFPYDFTNQKLQAFGGTTEVANATDLSAVKTRVVAQGV